MKRKKNNTYTLFIVCRNNQDSLIRSLPVILSSCNRDNIIAFDTQSEDKTRDLLRNSGIKIVDIKIEEFGHGKTRNLALDYSDAETLVFLNGDAIPYPNWLDALIKGINGNDAAFSRQIPDERCDPLRITDLVNHPYFGKNKKLIINKQNNLPIMFDTVSCAIKRASLHKQRFPNVLFGEDFLWAESIVKSGGSIVYIPESIVVHSHSIYRETKTLIKRHFEEGRLKRHHKKDYGLKYSLGFIPSAFLLDTITLCIINMPTKEKALWLLKEPLLRSLQLLSFYAGLNEDKIPDIIKENLLWAK